MEGGPDNPLGARALYLGSTLYRIHGSNEPWTIGQAVSSGCIRMRNEDVIDLYERVGVGTKVDRHLERGSGRKRPRGAWPPGGRTGGPHPHHLVTVDRLPDGAQLRIVEAWTGLVRVVTGGWFKTASERG